jgi:hypothetical protein
MNKFATACLAFCGMAGLAMAQAPLIVYDDSLQNGWENWSWAANDVLSTNPVHGGSQAISVSAGAWEALYVHGPAMNSGSYTSLTFWIHGGTAGAQSLQVQGTLGGAPQGAVVLAPLASNVWRSENISLQDLGVAGSQNLDGFWIQSRSGSPMPPFYVDDIRFLAGPTVPPGTATVVTVSVDAAAGRHPIDPRIYGVAFARSNQLRVLNAPLNRSGGNGTSRYNWATNASNRASDWYFESLADAGAVPGGSADDFVRDSHGGGAAPMLTVPINGWVAKLGAGRARLCSYSIAKYGAQTDSDSAWFPDAGNGIRAADGLRVTNNDPTDANLAVGPAFQSDWIRHLTNLWGSAANGGVPYYFMDNEWGLWHETHRDVWPVGATMEQMRDRFCEYAAMVKAADPAALVLGPEEWGWTGYFYSGYDAQWGGVHGWSGPFPDRSAHGNSDLMPWWLDQVARRSAASGKRLLDAFTLHFYPQGGEYGSNVSSAMQLRRNRSTRALWDTNYVDETWIGDKVCLIPRMRAWATNYPGTPIGITEYNWGAEEHMNGATAQADVLGIFGREGLDLATRWTCPETNTPAALAFRMYRNYDGTNAAFGDTSVSATAPDPDTLSAFAAVRNMDGALTVVLVNKRPAEVAPVALAIASFQHSGIARIWQLASNALTRVADVEVPTNSVNLVLPPQSVTLLCLPGRPRLERPLMETPGLFTFRLRGESGQSIEVEHSDDLIHWQTLSTEPIASNPVPVSVETRDSRQFFRGVWRR